MEFGKCFKFGPDYKTYKVVSREREKGSNDVYGTSPLGGASVPPPPAPGGLSVALCWHETELTEDGNPGLRPSAIFCHLTLKNKQTMSQEKRELMQEARATNASEEQK